MKANLKLSRYFFVVTGILTLTGCAGMTSPPSCPDSSGLSCARVDQINTMIDRGQFDGTPIGPVSKKGEAEFNSASPAYRDPVSLTVPLGPDEKMNKQIWLAPYKDKAGSYHPARLINSLITPEHENPESVKKINGHLE